MRAATGLVLLGLSVSDISLVSGFLHPAARTVGISNAVGGQPSCPAGASQRRNGVVMMGKAKRKKDFNYEEILGPTEAREEGVWPSSMTPWEALLGPFEPLMYDPEDFEDEEDPLALQQSDDEEDEELEGEEEWERAGTMEFDMSMVPEVRH